MNACTLSAAVNPILPERLKYGGKDIKNASRKCRWQEKKKIQQERGNTMDKMIRQRNKAWQDHDSLHK